ncbi:MAG: hypothetical protein AAFR46_14525 [Pseudomonadota bacterium]
MGIDDTHHVVAEKIRNGEPGYAQADILFDRPPPGTEEIRYKVSYTWGHPGTLSHAAVMFEPESWNHRRILDAIIVEVAKLAGQASPATFLRSRITYMIENARSFPKSGWAGKHAEADLLEQFYLKGAGQALLRS